jgi:hypothetical protein
MANKQVTPKTKKVSAKQIQKADACLQRLTGEMTLNELLAYLSEPLNAKQLLVADKITAGIAAGSEQVEKTYRPKVARATPPLAAARHLYDHCQYLAYQHAGIMQ